MKKNEQEKLKDVLLDDKKRIEGDLKSLSNTNFGSDVDSGDEESDETEAMAANFSIYNNLKKRLGRINKALDKIKNGKYGICESCGNTIPIKRLTAKPESITCIECKTNG